MSPKVSVIIPAYNAELFIGDAINSVLAQNSISDKEILVIDDGSTDNTRAVVAGIAACHREVVLLTNDRAKGPSGARNSGLLKATGDYIAFLDADDVWLENHIEEGVRFLENNSSIDVVFYNFEIYDYETNQKTGDWFSQRNFSARLRTTEIGNGYHLICDDIFKALLQESFMHLQSMIVRGAVTQGVLFNESVRRSEDRDFSIKLYLHWQSRFAFRDMITGIYYRHSMSLTNNTMQNTLSTLLDHKKLFREYLSLESVNSATKKTIRLTLFEKYMSTCYCYRKLHCHKLAFRSLCMSYLYSIAGSQLSEFAKISLSFMAHTLQKITRRVT